MRFITSLICGLLFCLQEAMPQQDASGMITLQGQVTDKDTGEPINMAVIHVSQSGSNKLAGYTFTDENGRFSLQAKSSDSLLLSVSLLGYKTYQEWVGHNRMLYVSLEQQVFNLREVLVRPGRVWNHRDTINYDITQFLSGTDETIRDVIKKLPGVDVDETGQISYNGKNISNLYIEGMDVSSGRYNKITNNLQARSVKTVQLMQNHQPIRILQNKISTGDVAMNIRLKPEFRDKWMFTVRGGGGSPLLWDASVNAMQLSRKSQSTYTYKGNNTGNDVVDELIMLISRISGCVREPDAFSFLHQPSIMAPLKKERLLFNDTHSISGNRIYRLNETTQLRINADYTHDVRKQERGSEISYFHSDDTVRMAEQSERRIQSDETEFKFYLENNAAEKYLTNELDISGNRQKSHADITGNRTIRQQIKTSGSGIRNNLRCLWNKSDYTYEAHSLLRYYHHPSELITDEWNQYLKINSFYTDNYFSTLCKKGIFSQQYSAGFNIENSNLQNRYGIYLNPLWQLNNGKWQTHLSVPLLLSFFSEINNAYTGGETPVKYNKTTRMTVNPSFSALYKPNYAWRFSLSARYNEQYGSTGNLYTLPYYTDYRHIIQNNGIVPVQRMQNYAVYGENKNTVSEFFTTLSLNYSRNWSNLTGEQTFVDDKIICSSHLLPTVAHSWIIRSTLSKGFYDIKMKLSLDYLFNHTRSQQLNNGKKIPYQLRYMQFEPKLSQTLSRHVEIAYEGNFRYGGSRIGDNTELTPLWNIIQKVKFNYTFSDFEITVSADHYHNDINDALSVNACFADASFKWKHYDWQFIASAGNLFDKRQYGYTQYSGIQSYTSWIEIRGREFLLSAKYRF